MSKFVETTTAADGTVTAAVRDGTPLEALNPMTIPVDTTGRLVQFGAVALVAFLIGRA